MFGDNSQLAFQLKTQMDTIQAQITAALLNPAQAANIGPLTLQLKALATQYNALTGSAPVASSSSSSSSLTLKILALMTVIGGIGGLLLYRKSKVQVKPPLRRRK